QIEDPTADAVAAAAPGSARSASAARGPVAPELAVAEVEGGEARDVGFGAGIDNPAAPADTAGCAAAALATRGLVVAERAVADGQSGIEVKPAEVCDGSADAGAAGFPRAAVAADGLVARERAVAHGERGGDSARTDKSGGAERGAAPAVAGIAARAARGANSQVTAEGAMGDREVSVGVEQAAAVAVPTVAPGAAHP